MLLHANTNASTLNSTVAVGSGSPAHVTSQSGGKSPSNDLTAQSPKSQQTSLAQAAANLHKKMEETYSGYNSGDEHLQPKEGGKTAGDF